MSRNICVGGMQRGNGRATEREGEKDRQRGDEV